MMNRVSLVKQIVIGLVLCRVVEWAQVRWKLTKGRDVITGTDYFTLLKTPDGWRIAALMFYND